jgi:foldase protein PrsA
MRNRTVVVALCAMVAVAMSSAVFAAPVAAKKATAKTAKFDQKAALQKYWNAPDNAVVGSVNGVNVTKGELLKAMWFWNAPNSLQELLNQKMIEQAAKKKNITLTKADLDAKIKESLNRMGMNSVDQLLEQFRITYSRFITGTKISALAEKIVESGIKVPDSDYAEWIKARHILIRFPQDEKDRTKQEEIAKKKIDEIAAKLKEGTDFAKLADEYSEDPGNDRNGVKQGGDLGWFTKGRMVQEFEKVAFQMKPGEVSEPVKTFYGYHLIKVDKLGKDATPAEKAELKKQILDRKTPMEMGKWFSELQAKAKIDNKLQGPPITQEPKPVVKPQPPKPQPKPKTEQPKSEEPKSDNQPTAPPSEKPETPPPPPPPPAD